MDKKLATIFTSLLIIGFAIGLGISQLAEQSLDKKQNSSLCEQPGYDCEQKICKPETQVSQCQPPKTVDKIRV